MYPMTLCRLSRDRRYHVPMVYQQTKINSKTNAHAGSAQLPNNINKMSINSIKQHTNRNESSDTGYPLCEPYLTNLAPCEQLNTKIEMTSKNGFPNLQANENHFYIFTDGFKSNEGAGYAAILTSCRGITEQPRGRLSTINSVFEAEACAVATALKIAKDKPFGSTFSIFSDSRSVLQAFMSGRKTIPFIAKLQKKIMVYN